MRAMFLMAAAVLAGCAPNGPVTEVAAHGRYRVTGTAGQVTPPPATLEIGRARYRFCEGSRCVDGRWSLQLLAADDGRITLEGPEVERYVLALSTAAYGQSATDRQRGVQGLIDLDWSARRIPLAVGEIAFVRE